MIKTTLNFLVDGDKVLLAMKKRGFGKDKWNGVGGKVLEQETFKDAVIRETLEEIGVEALHEHTEHVAILFFEFLDKPEWNQECHVFITRSWKGEPEESEEMRPQWYGFDEMPFDSMWTDDIHWVPKILNGERIKAKFRFSEQGATLESHDVTYWEDASTTVVQ